MPVPQDMQPDEASAGRAISAYSSLRAEALSLSELEQLRLTLRGGSVIDWYRMNFERMDEVDAFARLNGFDVDDPGDRQAVDRLRSEAASYLSRVLGYKIPARLTECDPRELALYASEAMGNRRDRMFSCILLKVMHVIHHIAARELRFVLPISDADVNQMLVQRVEACAEQMRRRGFPLLDFVGGQKRRDSVIAKLLVKRDNLAVEVYDRVRFRFVVAEPNDLVPTLRFLLQEVVPFNYVVPGQTQNDLIDFAALLHSHPSYRAHESKLQLDVGQEEERRRAYGPRNEFSGQTYRVVNFVADIPLVVPDDQLLLAGYREELGRVVFAVAEFQVIDAEIARINDSGDNAHHRYKSRQRARERQRLERGVRGVSGRKPR